jgi:transposase
LLEPDLDATNYRAEQALRLGVINRKVWGGNRDDSGRAAQQVLMSINSTCFQHHLCPIDFVSRSLRTWAPQLIPP